MCPTRQGGSWESLGPHLIRLDQFEIFQATRRDAARPTAAFEIAERFRPGSYDLTLLAPGGGQVESSSGLKLSAETLKDGSPDTIIVSAGEIGRSMPTLQDLTALLAIRSFLSR